MDLDHSKVLHRRAYGRYGRETQIAAACESLRLAGCQQICDFGKLCQSTRFQETSKSSCPRRAGTVSSVNALSSSRLIASDRDGFGSGWRSIQASSLAF